RELINACEYYQSKKGKMITLEYILIRDVNDGLDQVKPLAELARRLNAKVNLIPYNKVEDLHWERPEDEAQEAFAEALNARGVTAPSEIQDACALVLPGVGAFDDCINALRKQELLGASCEFIKTGRAFLGICVGYQALFEKSDEFNSCAAGLCLFGGRVVRFD